MNELPSVATFLATGARAAKFPTQGTEVVGTVVFSEVTQQTEFETGKLKFWDDGNPAMQLVVTVQTEERDRADDDGMRRIFVKGQMKHALQMACSAAGLTDLTAGDLLKVSYAADGEARKGLAAPKQYLVKVKAGEPVVEAVVVDDEEPF